MRADNQAVRRKIEIDRHEVPMIGGVKRSEQALQKARRAHRASGADLRHVDRPSGRRIGALERDPYPVARNGYLHLLRRVAIPLITPS